MNVRKRVADFLLDYNFPTKFIGFAYLKESLIKVLEGDGIQTCRILFRQLAEQFNSSELNIDRCLRTIVDKMWAPLAVLELFTCKPSIREFIFKCAEHITHRKEMGSAYGILTRPC